MVATFWNIPTQKTKQEQYQWMEEFYTEDQDRHAAWELWKEPWGKRRGEGGMPFVPQTVLLRLELTPASGSKPALGGGIRATTSS